MKRTAFTLVELLIVVFIIGLLASLLLPAVQHVREAARTSQCQSNLHQLGIGIHEYESASGFLPLYCKWRRDDYLLVCPLKDELGLSDYRQNYSDSYPIKRTALMEDYQLPSDKIGIVQDPQAVHHDLVNMLYLDGHVSTTTY